MTPAIHKSRAKFFASRLVAMGIACGHGAPTRSYLEIRVEPPEDALGQRAAIGKGWPLVRRRQRTTPRSSQWLSTREAAELTGFSELTLRAWARNHLVPDIDLVKTPGAYLWSRAFAARPVLLTVRPALPSTSEAGECLQQSLVPLRPIANKREGSRAIKGGSDV